MSVLIGSPFIIWHYPINEYRVVLTFSWLDVKAAQIWIINKTVSRILESNCPIVHWHMRHEQWCSILLLAIGVLNMLCCPRQQYTCIADCGRTGRNLFVASDVAPIYALLSPTFFLLSRWLVRRHRSLRLKRRNAERISYSNNNTPI